jgi:hypothetical protein
VTRILIVGIRNGRLPGHTMNGACLTLLETSLTQQIATGKPATQRRGKGWPLCAPSKSVIPLPSKLRDWPPRRLPPESIGKSTFIFYSCVGHTNCHRNRNIIALKASIAHDRARKACCLAEDATILLAMRQRNRLDRALWDVEPNESDQE